MRFVDPPTLDSPWQERPGDELDGLLTAYFHRELPSPWPAAPQVEEAPVILRRQPTPRKPFWNSRLALVASIAVLLAGGWMLSGTFLDLPRDGAESNSKGDSATKPKHFKGRVRTSIPHLPSGETGFRFEFFPGDMDEDELEKKIGNDNPLPQK